MKRLIAIILIVVLGIMCCSCAMEDLPEESQLGAYSGEEEQTVEILPARESISMIYYEDMDQNPLTTTNSENHELLKLVYSPLVRLNGSMVAEYVLAESVSNVDKTVKVTLKKDLLFSNGKKVKASDVTAGLRTIRNTKTSPYYDQLLNVRDYWAEDDRTVVIKLKEPDVDFINYLDIPVKHRDSEAGCGPYRFSKQNGKTVLVPNKKYFEQPIIKEIVLKAPANEKERQNMFSVGLLDVFFLPTESALTFSGGKDYRQQTLAGDHLLYLGVNNANPQLKKAGVRQYLSGLLDREKLVESVLLGRGDATAYPFQPTWYKAAGLTHSKDWSDPEKKELAQKLGFTLEENLLRDQKGKPLTFTLLINKSSAVHRDLATALADNCSLSGITLKIASVSKKDYQARLAEGKYDFYLGEVKTGRTVNTALYTEGSGVFYGGVDAKSVLKAAEQYGDGTRTLSDFAAAFAEKTPIIPIAYRQGVLLASTDIGDFQSTGTWSVYGNISKLKTLEIEVSK